MVAQSQSIVCTEHEIPRQGDRPAELTKWNTQLWENDVEPVAVEIVLECAWYVRARKMVGAEENTEDRARRAPAGKERVKG